VANDSDLTEIREDFRDDFTAVTKPVGGSASGSRPAVMRISSGIRQEIGR
jgi:hypothetical protein